MAGGEGESRGRGRGLAAPVASERRPTAPLGGPEGRARRGASRMAPGSGRGRRASRSAGLSITPSPHGDASARPTRFANGRPPSRVAARAQEPATGAAREVGPQRRPLGPRPRPAAPAALEGGRGSTPGSGQAQEPSRRAALAPAWAPNASGLPGLIATYQRSRRPSAATKLLRWSSSPTDTPPQVTIRSLPSAARHAPRGWPREPAGHDPRSVTLAVEGLEQAAACSGFEL